MAKCSQQARQGGCYHRACTTAACTPGPRPVHELSINAGCPSSGGEKDGMSAISVTQPHLHHVYAEG